MSAKVTKLLILPYVPNESELFHESEFAILVKWSFAQFCLQASQEITKTPNNFALDLFHLSF